MTQEIKVGDVSIARIENMHGPLLPTDQLFPDMPQEAWDRFRDELVPDHLGVDGMVHVAFQTWLIRSGGRTILIDTGIGNDKPRPAVGAWDHLKLGYLDNLSGAGVEPEDVDLVVNTHLHVDHVGWNTQLVDGEWIPTFPNATYLMPKIDFEYWDPANNPSIVGGVNENVFEDSIAPVRAAGQVQLWEGPTPSTPTSASRQPPATLRGRASSSSSPVQNEHSSQATCFTPPSRSCIQATAPASA
jgi:hypothetical protein